MQKSGYPHSSYFQLHCRHLPCTPLNKQDGWSMLETLGWALQTWLSKISERTFSQVYRQEDGVCVCGGPPPPSCLLVFFLGRPEQDRTEWYCFDYSWNQAVRTTHSGSTGGRDGHCCLSPLPRGELEANWRPVLWVVGQTRASGRCRVQDTPYSFTAQSLLCFSQPGVLARPEIRTTAYFGMRSLRIRYGQYVPFLNSTFGTLGTFSGLLTDMVHLFLLAWGWDFSSHCQIITRVTLNFWSKLGI